MTTTLEAQADNIVLEGIINPVQYIALVGFEDLEDTLYVGTFNSQAEAQDAADRAFAVVEDIAFESDEPIEPGYPAVITNGDYVEQMKARVAALAGRYVGV